MICGTKADIEKFIPYVSEELATALQYIAETDFSNLADGEYPIDGDKVFARLSHYTTEPKEAKKPESHNQYIDVQYLAEGTEKIYYTAKANRPSSTSLRTAWCLMTVKSRGPAKSGSATWTR